MPPQNPIMNCLLQNYVFDYESTLSNCQAALDD